MCSFAQPTWGDFVETTGELGQKSGVRHQPASIGVGIQIVLGGSIHGVGGSVQIILVSRHLKAARTITIMPRHLLAVAVLFLSAVLVTALLFSWLSLYWRLPVVEDALLAIQQRQTRETRDFITNNLQMMATRLGELQGRVIQLDTQSAHLSDVAGVKRDKERSVPAVEPGRGGPFLPVSMSASELYQEIERLSGDVDRRADELALLEFKILEKRVQDRLMPTTLPVKEALIGSGFGFRSDPFSGVKSRHDGLDFSAPSGTPVYAAADGVVLEATFHPEFGNVVDVDHGEGLMSRYAHLTEYGVKVGQLIRRGERLGSVGTTGRSTGPHLHFEVRMLGVPQNPAAFLKRSEEFASLQRR